MKSMAEKYDHEALMTSVWKSWEIAQHRPWETWINTHYAKLLVYW